VSVNVEKLEQDIKINSLYNQSKKRCFIFQDSPIFRSVLVKIMKRTFKAKAHYNTKNSPMDQAGYLNCIKKDLEDFKNSRDATGEEEQFIK
jgi:hypothetical protein